MNQKKTEDPIAEFEEAVKPSNSALGRESVEVVCYLGAKTDKCSGWEETVELTDEAYLPEDGNQPVFPGFDWECPFCGQEEVFYIEDDIEFRKMRQSDSRELQQSTNGSSTFDDDTSDEYGGEAFDPQMDYGGLEKIAPELRERFSKAYDKRDVKPEPDDSRWYVIHIDPGRGTYRSPDEDVRVVHGPVTLEDANRICNRGHPDTHRVVSDTVLRLGEQSEKVEVKRSI